MILPINHVEDWRYIRQRKQTRINKYVIRENYIIIDNYYREGDKFLTKNKSVYKLKNLFKVPYKTVQMWTNRTVTLQMGAVKNIIRICNIKPYNDPNVE